MYELESPLDTHGEFYGREKESQTLQRALRDKQGGTILIAGDRGSGKTSLVNDVLVHEKSLGRNRLSPFRLTRQFYAEVDLPFIPKHLLLETNSSAEIAGELSADVTSTVLRAITQSLVNENESLRKPWLDIRMKFFRPLGYNRVLRILDRLTRYVSIRETKSGKLSVAKPAVVSTDFKRESDLDLSDTIIEVKLRGLLGTYSNKMKFVFVFDELDKQETSRLAIKLATYLKNLFTQCGAHFIFVTSEDTYKHLRDMDEINPYSEAHTLFTEKILVNYLESRSFIKTFTSLFAPQTREEMYKDRNLPIATLALEWDSKNHIFDALNTFKKSLSHNSYTQSLNVENLRGELGSFTWDTGSALQLFIDYLIEKYGHYDDEYYRRYLYRVLRTVAENISTSPEIIIKPSNMLSALFRREEFDDVADEIGNKSSMGRRTAPDALIGEEDNWKSDWRHDLYSLPSNKLESIETATMELLWLMDRCGGTSLKRENSPEILSCTFEQANFNIYKVLDLIELPQSPRHFSINKLFEANPEEEELLNATNEINPQFEHGLNSNVWIYYDAAFIASDDSSKPKIVANELRRRLSVDIQAYRESLFNSARQEAQGVILDELQKTILAMGSSPEYVEGDSEHRLLRVFNGGIHKYVMLRFNATRAQISEDLERDLRFRAVPTADSSISIINIQDVPSEQRKSTHDASEERVKDYVLRPDWSNLSQLKHNVITRAQKYV